MLSPAPIKSELSRSDEIENVKENLERIIEWSVENQNRNGYFAALYKNISARVQDGIFTSAFDDPMRMEKFVKVFAGYYIDAFEDYKIGNLENSNPWYQVFEQGKRKRTILQHLLLGVNTHINFDLPNTCVKIAPGTDLMFLCNDYVRINSILAASIDQVEKQIFKLSPILSVMSRFISKLERKLLNFSLGVARGKSWEFACQQALGDKKAIAYVQAQCQEMTHKICLRIINPGRLSNILIFLINLTEVKSMGKNIQVLNATPEFT
ncbi:hypothetical protein BH23BAC1_BH23BAC1_30570 [soil metagenome]